MARSKFLLRCCRLAHIINANLMLRMKVDHLIALAFLGTATLGIAAERPIGVALSQGGFRADNSVVFGNTTVFDGTMVQTTEASSRLQLTSGARIELAVNSRAKVFKQRAALEQGVAELASSLDYRLEARTLRISPLDNKSIARVKLEGDKQVSVAAVNGRVRVSTEAGLLVANVAPGKSLLFTPQAAQAETFQVSGCLLRMKTGQFLLVDPNQTVELRGSGLEQEINNRVEVAGTAFRSAVPTPPATQVIQVDRLKQVAVDTCLEAIDTIERTGVKVVRPGETVKAAGPAVKAPSHAGIYAGVAVAVGGGVGAAVALSGGKKSTSP